MGIVKASGTYTFSNATSLLPGPRIPDTCQVGRMDACLIGIGATVLDAAVIGKHSLVAAGALVTPNTKVPPESLVMGIPAVVKRRLTPAEIDNLETSARRYVGYANNYRTYLADRQDLLVE